MSHTLKKPLAALITFCCIAAPVFADENEIEAILGGPYISCQGSITWTGDNDSDELTNDDLRLAMLDHDEAASILFYFEGQPVSEEDVWRCEGGICSSFRATASGTTTNAIRLSGTNDDSEPSIEYSAGAVFSVIAAEDNALTQMTLSGAGTFTCNKTLPSGVATVEG